MLKIFLDTNRYQIAHKARQWTSKIELHWGETKANNFIEPQPNQKKNPDCESAGGVL